MKNNFNPAEILNISIKVEENGYNLYASLEKSAKDQKLKKVWGYLKGQEEIHRDIFGEMFKKQADYIVYDYNPPDYDNYIRAVSSEYIFIPEIIEKKIQEGFSSDRQAIDFAISIEKESVLVYTVLKEYVKKAKQYIVHNIIEEEKKHVVELVSLKECLGKGE